MKGPGEEAIELLEPIVYWWLTRNNVYIAQPLQRYWHHRQNFIICCVEMHKTVKLIHQSMMYTLG